MHINGLSGLKSELEKNENVLAQTWCTSINEGPDVYDELLRPHLMLREGLADMEELLRGAEEAFEKFVRYLPCNPPAAVQPR